MITYGSGRGLMTSHGLSYQMWDTGRVLSGGLAGSLLLEAEKCVVIRAAYVRHCPSPEGSSGRPMSGIACHRRGHQGGLCQASPIAGAGNCVVIGAAYGRPRPLPEPGVVWSAGWPISDTARHWSRELCSHLAAWPSVVSLSS